MKLWKCLETLSTYVCYSNFLITVHLFIKGEERACGWENFRHLPGCLDCDLCNMYGRKRIEKQPLTEAIRRFVRKDVATANGASQ